MNEIEFKEFIEGNSIIVLDTNVLLSLFKYSSYSSLNIIKVLSACLDKLWIPDQVYKEFIKNKSREQSKIKKKYQNFQTDLITEVRKTKERLINRINESKKLEYPKCDLLESKIDKHSTNLISEIENYKKELGVEYKISIGMERVDEINTFVDSLVEKGRIGSEITYSEMISTINEGELRYKYKLPPGYEDAKTKEGIDIYGDLFIWKEIVRLPQNLKVSSVLFVTNDIKEDWWVLKGSQKKPEKIRSELKKEFNEINCNSNIKIITLPDFHERASKYYNLPSFHTELELNSEEYCFNVLIPMFNEQLWNKLYCYAVEQDITDFSDEFYKCNDNEIMGSDISIQSCAFRIEGDNAIYSVSLHMPVEMYLSYEDNEGDSFEIGQVDYTLTANVEFFQEVDIEENKLCGDIDFEIQSFEIVDLTIIDPYDYYSDDDAHADMYDALEEYHKH